MKKVLVAIIIIIVLAVLIGAGVYVYLYFNHKIGPGLPPEGYIPQNKATEGWKTYTNTEYGFSFQYPEDYSISNGSSAANRNEWCIWLTGKYEIQGPFVCVSNSDLSLDAFVLNEKSQTYTNAEGFTIKSDTQTSLNGIPARKLVCYYNGMGGGTEDYFFIKRGSFIFRIGASDDESSSYGESFSATTQHKIVNSFKFINK